MKKAGFTLAEVLITLGIIGVVASITLPALIQNNRNKELQTGLKRSYSVIAQALDLYNADYGVRLTPDNVKPQELKGKLVPYFRISKDCGFGSEANAAEKEKSCIPSYGTEGVKASTKYKNLVGKSTIELSKFDDGQFVLIDGTLVLLENASYGQLFVSVDVNGYNKRPNRLGQDLFIFEINEKGALLPMGVKGTYYYSENDEYCSPSSSDSMNGAGCTYKALNEKDYFDKLQK